MQFIILLPFHNIRYFGDFTYIKGSKNKESFSQKDYVVPLINERDRDNTSMSICFPNEII